MANVRVFSLARDLNLTSREVTERLKKLGVEVKTASSSVDEDTADKLRRALKIDVLTKKRKRVFLGFLTVVAVVGLTGALGFFLLQKTMAKSALSGLPRSIFGPGAEYVHNSVFCAGNKGTRTGMEL